MTVSIPSTQTTEATILVDAHVHIYDCFDTDTLLQAAWNNFHKQSNTPNFSGVLLLTETAKDNWFGTLTANLKETSETTFKQGDWTFSPTAEPCSLFAKNAQGHELIIMAGRQVITAEKLEVLALMTEAKFEEGRSLTETLTAIHNSGGLPVLPWGVGKWLGNRGKLIAQRLASSNSPTFFLGDNSNRPQFWKRPPHFSTIEQQGKAILPGTDPLPIASEAQRPGSFGLTLSGPLSQSAPAQQLKALLLEPDTHWQPYGALEKPLPFLRNQIAMRV
ncbi:MAG: hypothetical protein AB8B99_20885 [Phormidesmis sp.]